MVPALRKDEREPAKVPGEQKPEDRGRKTEDKFQRTEDRKLKTVKGAAAPHTVFRPLSSGSGKIPPGQPQECEDATADAIGPVVWLARAKHDAVGVQAFGHVPGLGIGAAGEVVQARQHFDSDKAHGAKGVEIVVLGKRAHDAFRPQPWILAALAGRWQPDRDVRDLKPAARRKNPK